MKNILVRVLTVLYPLGFALAPILALYANNMGTFGLDVVRAPMLYAVLGTLAVLVAALQRLRNLRKTAVVTSYLAILFFSHGHFQRIAVDLGVPEWLAGWLLLVLGSALAVAGAVGVARANNVRLLTRLLSIAGVAMLSLPLLYVVTFEVATRRSARTALDSLAVAPLRVEPQSGALPDIYYIVLDGYGRQDVLLEHFGHDNSSFLEELASRGFHVAREAHSNYSQTALTMASVFNMDYVQNLVVTRPRFSDLGPLRERIRDNRVMGQLRKLGYTIVTFSSATDIVNLQSPDIHFQGRSLDEFRVGVLDLTPIPVLAGRLRTSTSLPLEPYRAHHANVRFKFEQLQNLRSYKRPFFVYAHFLCPHPPFVFDADGTFRDPRRAYTIRERDWIEGYREGYRRQVEFVNARLRETIDAILERSPTPPVIILQSDHGPASGWLDFWSRNKHWLTQEPEIIRERMAVLYALRVPGWDARPLGARTSPVNTFRLVMNACFGTQLELLPDHAYFSGYESPYNFVQVDALLDADPDESDRMLPESASQDAPEFSPQTAPEP